MKNFSRMFIDLAAGVLISGLIIEIITLIVTDKKVYYSIGLLVGIAYALFTLWGINDSVQTSVLMTEDGALKNTRIKYIIRVVILVTLLVLFYVFDFGSAITFIIGAFTLKISTYMQPLMDKVIGSKIN